MLQPERIDPKNFGLGYDVRSDVWSLGITLVSPRLTRDISNTLVCDLCGVRKFNF